MSALPLAHPRTLRRLILLAAGACLLILALLAGTALLLWNRAAGWIAEQDFSGAPQAVESLVGSLAAELPASAQTGAQLLSEASGVVADAKALAAAVTASGAEVAPVVAAQLADTLQSELGALSSRGAGAVAQADAALTDMRDALSHEPVDVARAALTAAGLAAVDVAGADPAGLPRIEGLVRTGFHADAQSQRVSYLSRASTIAVLDGLSAAAASSGFEVRVLPSEGARRRLQLSRGERQLDVAIEPAAQGSTLQISESLR